MRQQLIVGMPDSGKSTYIAAMRHLLVANQIDAELELTALAAHERHLNKLEERWLKLEQVERTQTQSEGWVEFHIRNKRTGAESALSIPDLKGETFEQPACKGYCNRALLEAVALADGLLLFTNAEHEDEALLISDLADIHSEVRKPAKAGAARKNIKPSLKSVAEDEAKHEHEDEEPEEATGPIPFDPDKMPEEVKIVEFLQMANRRPRYPKLRRIALMVSAWDVVSEPMKPDGWLEEKRPMLAQFLAHNADLWDLRVYGVSAQGGRLPRDRAALRKIRVPSERITVVGHGAQKHDLTSPLCWLGGL